MRRMLCLGAVCAAVAMISAVGPPRASASQGQQGNHEAVASSPGQTVALVVEETAAVLPHAAPAVVLKSEIGFIVAAQFASPPVGSEGAALVVSTSAVTVGQESAIAKKSSPEVAPVRLLQ